MSDKFKVGDLLKSGSGYVFSVESFTENRRCIPDGWPVDKYGSAHNPNFCRHYSGALSALKGIANV